MFKLGWSLALLIVAVPLLGAEPESDGAHLLAKAAIIALVGPDSYARYITPQGARSYPPDAFCIRHPSSCTEYLKHPYSIATFKLKMPEYPFVDETISCIVDDKGKVLNLEGVPPCARAPRECTFPYNEEGAREIATRVGLEPGVGGWWVKFHWHRTLGYVWEVKTTLGGTTHEPSGKGSLIDANDGQVVESFGWSTFH
jgi:hypothetical protein